VLLLTFARVQAVSKGGLRRGIVREARDKVLEVDCVSCAQAVFGNAKGNFRVHIEDIEVPYAVVCEEWARQGAVKHGAMKGDLAGLGSYGVGTHFHIAHG